MTLRWKNYVETVQKVLTEIAQEFSLEELNANNWEQYKYGALNLPNTSQFAAESNIQNQTLVAFFDIYENTTRNKFEDQVNKTQKVVQYRKSKLSV